MAQLPLIAGYFRWIASFVILLEQMIDDDSIDCYLKYCQ